MSAHDVTSEVRMEHHLPLDGLKRPRGGVRPPTPPAAVYEKKERRAWQAPETTDENAAEAIDQLEIFDRYKGSRAPILTGIA
uniref:Uncharacterized protein n=1 Tax=Oryza glumipatula TaxID=40148 RepID=A0A0D9Y2G6_9ORYZ